MLTKAVESVKVFAENNPSLRDLARGRRRRFDDVECVLPSRVVTTESLSATVSVWDEYLRLLPDYDGTLTVDSTDPEAIHPEAIDFELTDEAVTELAGVAFETPGVQYLTLTDESGRRFTSNPVQVFESEPDERLYWGDIHLHSQFSDGAGSMSKGFEFGRDVMDLDVVAYTDHDTMGFFIPPKLQRRRMHGGYFEDMKTVTKHFHDPGEFVTLFGYEWTKQPNMGGHINVYFEGVDEAELFDSLDTDTNRYEKLFRRLQEWREETGNEVLAIPHHPAEAMYPFDFSNVDYDDDIAPLVEVYSQWGSSETPEADGNPKPVRMGQGEMGDPGHYVQDAHELGYRVGMMGSSDFHAPRPGRSHIHLPPHLPSLSDIWEDGVGWGHIWRIWDEGSYPGGLTGFYAEDLSRESIFESLRSRRVYATSQPHRILAEFAVDGTAVGEDDSTVTADGERTVEWLVAGTAPIERVTVVKNNADWHVVGGTTDESAGLDTYTEAGEVTDDEPVTGMAWDDDRGSDADVYYLRVEQADDGMAWAGPVWVEPDA
ncbi:DUF3604 domain-containing protein [Halosimplex pelagicum]|uniref:DUF3604 domain-containing protein n=1 Tax=Halosimplex pelagicum TaxID=869886 RepID=A0A7D5TEJ5_9EURY|nr:DUF3604 domain-containing protein [Halosimplex pelagicum]QLH83935.1 DUF3604 domain-containing protein [Halosimplex pelagicum]